MNKKFNKYLLFPQNFSEKASFRPQKQCCGSKYIEFGSGSRISAQFGSGSSNLLNTDPDSDPQHWLNLKWGVVKFSSKTDPELKNSFVTVDTFNIVTFPILFQKFIFEVIHFETNKRCHETIYYKVLLPFYDEKWAMVKTVGNLDFHDNI